MRKFYETLELNVWQFGEEEIVRTSEEAVPGNDVGKDPFDDGWTAPGTTL